MMEVHLSLKDFIKMFGEIPVEINLADCKTHNIGGLDWRICEVSYHVDGRLNYHAKLLRFYPL